MLVLIGIVIIGWLVYRVPAIHKYKSAGGIRLFILFMTVSALGMCNYVVEQWQEKSDKLRGMDKYTAVLTGYNTVTEGSGKMRTIAYIPFYEFVTKSGDSIEYKAKNSSMGKPIEGSEFTIYYNQQEKDAYVVDAQMIISIAVIVIALIISVYFVVGLLVYSVLPNRVRYKWVEVELAYVILILAFYIIIQLCICLMVFSGYHYSWAMIIVYLVISTYLTVRAFRTNIKEWIEEFRLR
ncbi:MAG: hypothetical protein ACRCVU_09270 [Flavobacterium sp.]